ncbi:MAG: ABC transporter permease [Chitinophagaceae bacterium]
MFKNYFKTAWRRLIKNKMHSFINIVGLSLGMAVAVLISLWMYDELSFNKNFDNYNRIAQVEQNLVNNDEVDTWDNTPFPLAEVLRKLAAELPIQNRFIMVDFYCGRCWCISDYFINCKLPGIKAAIANPVKSLRTE